MPVPPGSPEPTHLVYTFSGYAADGAPVFRSYPAVACKTPGSTRVYDARHPAGRFEATDTLSPSLEDAITRWQSDVLREHERAEARAAELRERVRKIPQLSEACRRRNGEDIPRRFG